MLTAGKSATASEIAGLMTARGDGLGHRQTEENRTGDRQGCVRDAVGEEVEQGERVLLQAGPFR